MWINNVVLPEHPENHRYDVEFALTERNIKSRGASGHLGVPAEPPSLLLPPLCHPHIHLDKAYLLTSRPSVPDASSYPDYSDLALESGSFSEALQKTSQAKTRYTVPDLLLRGSQLIAESIQYGVTSMRAFVEIDHVTQFKCLDAAVELKRRFAKQCYVQICAFAQDPIMSGEHGEENLRLMEQALAEKKYEGQIEVLGSTPYVEDSFEKGIDNVRWAVATAIEKKLHLDFHLDYNVDEESKPMIWDVVRLLKEASWTGKAIGKKVVIGHCTRTTIFSKDDMKRLAKEIDGLPIGFVGLPTSDLFMMGRLSEDDKFPGNKQRGTLQILDLIQEYKFEACIGVNNVGNAFTPWGNADPLRLASLGVGLYHAGTAEHAKLLYQCVSTRARSAIGLEPSVTGSTNMDDRDKKDEFEDFISRGNAIMAILNEGELTIAGVSDAIPARQRLTIKDVVWDPPDSKLRRVIHSD